MNSYIILKKEMQKKLPSKFKEDGRFDQRLLKYIINNFTNDKSLIIDPFAGYGTTISVAEKLKRNAWGFEINKDKYLYALSEINNKERLINDNVKNISNYFKSFFDICITSPTYSWKNMGCNPFNLDNINEGYKEYLNDYKNYFKQVVKAIKPGGLIIIDTANINFLNICTTLAWDIKYNLEKIEYLKFEKEIVVCWDNNNDEYLGGKYGFGYDHSYILIFRKALKK